MGYIREYYERIIKLKESEWEFIASHFDKKVFAKNQIITRQGETENYLSFVESGIIRFYIPDEENELTFNFSFDKEFTCAYTPPSSVAAIKVRYSAADDFIPFL